MKRHLAVILDGLGGQLNQVSFEIDAEDDSAEEADAISEAISDLGPFRVGDTIRIVDHTEAIQQLDEQLAKARV